MENIIERIVELTKQDDKSIIERGLKGTEEMGEIAQAILSHCKTSGCGYKGKSEDDVIEECADLYLIIMSIVIHVQSYGFDEDKFKKMLQTKMDKWEQKIKESAK